MNFRILIFIKPVHKQIYIGSSLILNADRFQSRQAFALMAANPSQDYY